MLTLRLPAALVLTAGSLIFIDERPYDPRPYDSRYSERDRERGYGGGGGRYEDRRSSRYDERRYDDRRYDDRRYDDRRYDERRY